MIFAQFSIHSMTLATWQNSGGVFGRTGEAYCTNWKTARMRDGLCFYVRTAKTLQELSRMEGMTRVCTIMMDEKESEETIAATTQSAKTNNNPNKLLIIIAIL